MRILSLILVQHLRCLRKGAHGTCDKNTFLCKMDLKSLYVSDVSEVFKSSTSERMGYVSVCLVAWHRGLQEAIFPEEVDIVFFCKQLFLKCVT